jgi:hypothetical protein
MLSYNYTLPTYKDFVRFLIDDTDPSNAILHDEEITALLNTVGYRQAIAFICERLVIRYGNQPSFFQEHYGIEVQWKSKVKVWEDLRDEARSGFLPDPFATNTNAYVAAIKQTAAQTADPARPLPSYTIPGDMGGYRSQ